MHVLDQFLESNDLDGQGCRTLSELRARCGDVGRKLLYRFDGARYAASLARSAADGRAALLIRHSPTLGPLGIARDVASCIERCGYSTYECKLERGAVVFDIPNAGLRLTFVPSLPHVEI